MEAAGSGGCGGCASSVFHTPHPHLTNASFTCDDETGFLIQSPYLLQISQFLCTSVCLSVWTFPSSGRTSARFCPSLKFPLLIPSPRSPLCSQGACVCVHCAPHKHVCTRSTHARTHAARAHTSRVKWEGSKEKMKRRPTSRLATHSGTLKRL